MDKKICFYKLNGTMQNEVDFNEENLKGTFGMKVRCVFKDGTEKVGYSCCNDNYYKNGMIDCISNFELWTLRDFNIDKPNMIYEQEFCLGRGVASFTPYKKLDSEFLYFTLKDILNYYENTLTGSIIVGISKDDLLNQIIHYPDDAQIAKFHKLTLPMFEQIRKYKKENEVLNSYKKFLLPLMLEGKINLKLKEVV